MSILLTLFGWLRKVPAWAWLAVAALCVIGWQHIEISHYRSVAATNEKAIKLYKDAEGTNLNTIAVLQDANKKWAGKDAADLALAKTYADASQAYAMKMQSQRNVAQHKLTVIYAQFPSVKAWSVAISTPADVSDQLRANSYR